MAVQRPNFGTFDFGTVDLSQGVQAFIDARERKKADELRQKQLERQGRLDVLDKKVKDAQISEIVSKRKDRKTDRIIKGQELIARMGGEISPIEGVPSQITEGLQSASEMARLDLENTKKQMAEKKTLNDAKLKGINLQNKKLQIEILNLPALNEAEGLKLQQELVKNAAAIKKINKENEAIDAAVNLDPEKLVPKSDAERTAKALTMDKINKFTESTGGEMSLEQKQTLYATTLDEVTKRSKQSITVNTGDAVTGGLPEYLQKGLATMSVDRISAAIEQGQEAHNSLQDISKLQTQVDNSFTGKGAQLKSSAAAWMASIVGAPDTLINTITNTQQLTAYFNKVVLQKAEAIKGALSDKDLMFLTNSTAKTTDTPTRIKIYLRGAKSKAELDALVGAYSSKITPQISRANYDALYGLSNNLRNVPLSRDNGKEQFYEYRKDILKKSNEGKSWNTLPIEQKIILENKILSGWNAVTGGGF